MTGLLVGENMNTEDYFKLYNLLLVTINDNHIINEVQLFKRLNADKSLKFLTKKYTDNMINTFISNTLINMLDDGVLRGKATLTKAPGYIFIFTGLTTDGINYITTIKSNTMLNKLKKAIHDEGLPLTPNIALKFLGKLFF